MTVVVYGFRCEPESYSAEEKDRLKRAIIQIKKDEKISKTNFLFFSGPKSNYDDLKKKIMDYYRISLEKCKIAVHLVIIDENGFVKFSGLNNPVRSYDETVSLIESVLK
ncbi:hypothetical protein ACFL1O_00275 [Patescibacteria group bacterium]